MTIRDASWEQRYQQLVDTAVSNNTEFHRWLRTWADLEAEVYEQGTALLRAYQADMTNVEVKRERQTFLTTRRPGLQALHDRAAQMAVEWSEHFSVPKDWRQAFMYFGVVARQAKQPSGDLDGQVELIGGELSALFSQLPYRLHGEPVEARTRAALAVSPDRAQRHAAFQSSREARLAVIPEVVHLMRRSLDLRREIARRAGYDTAHQHLWSLLERVDYTPQDVHTFRTSVREHLTPLLVAFRNRRKDLLRVEALKPWDLTIDPFGGAAQPRFADEAELIERVADSLPLPGLGDQVRRLWRTGLLDLTARPGKADRSYSDFLAHQRLPYVQMRLQPTPDAVQILYHELGHVAQLSGVKRGSPFWHHFPGVEMREFVAQNFELWSLNQLPTLFTFDDAPGHVLRFYEKTLARMVGQCVMDEFQEWFYSCEHTPDQSQMEEVWQHISDQYPIGIDREGLPASEPLGYATAQVVRRPLVGIEYALAWSWAFAFVSQAEVAPDQTFSHLAEALLLGNTRPLPELLRVAGVAFSLSATQVETLHMPMQQALNRAPSHRSAI